MRCPDCQAELPEGAEVCSYCLAVLPAAHETGGRPPPWPASQPSDTAVSQLQQPPPSRPQQAGAGRSSRGPRQHAPEHPQTGGPAFSPPPAPPRPRPPSRSLPPLPPRGEDGAAGDPYARQQVAAAPAAPSPPGFAEQAEIQTRMVSLDIQQDKGTQIVEVSLPAAVRRKVRAEEESSAAGRGAGGGWQLEVEESEVSHGVDEALRLARLFYARLHRLDRWAIKVFVATFIAAFLPWIHVRGEGLKAGVETLGAVSAAGVVAAIVCMYWRTIRRRKAALLVLLQLLLAVLITAAPVYRFLSFGGEDLQLSFGIFLTAIGGAVTVLLSLLRLALIGS